MTVTRTSAAIRPDRRFALLMALALGLMAPSSQTFAQGGTSPVEPPSFDIGGAPELGGAGAAVPDASAPTLPGAPETAPVRRDPAPALAAPVDEGGSAGTTAGAAQPGVAVTPAAGESTPAEGSETPAAPAEALSETPEEPASAPSAVAPTARLPHDLSPMGMYEAADIVVKGVMIGLAAASLLTWTVFLVKIFELTWAGRRAKATIRALRQSQTLQAAEQATQRHRGPAAFMLREAAMEYQASYAAVAEAGTSGLKERVSSVLSRVEAQAVRRMQRGTGLLASIGSVAPFVGLFGTVWGIMNSFIGIAESGTTNLAVVAPGIAEALLATAIGLVAAIPAVIFYNAFARAITGYRQRLADATAGIERLVSRDLDFGIAPRSADSSRRV